MLSCALDLILNEWFSTTNLLVPQMALVSLCQASHQAETVIDSKKRVPIRVEVFGSGQVLVPRIDIDVEQTPMGHLFDVVQRCYDKNNDSGHKDTSSARTDVSFRFICGSDAAFALKGQTRLVANVFDVLSNNIMYVVQVFDPELQERTALISLDTAADLTSWPDRGWRQNSNLALRWWAGVRLDEDKLHVAKVFLPNSGLNRYFRAGTA